LVKIYHFYHIYADGLWQIPVDQHFKALKKSKLYDSLTCPVKIGFVGNNENINNVKNFLNINNYNYEIVSIKSDGWEQVTQQELYNFSQYNDGYILYAHTKGSHSQQYPNIPWRETMTKYNVLNWNDCINKINEGYDATGIYWMNSLGAEHIGHNNFYAGTFWWTTLDFIKKLPPPNYEHRHRAEGWIGLNPINAFCFKNGEPKDYEELIL
jgi:hypothetical protein